MIVEVEQSVKVEQTHRDTVLAFSDGIHRTLLIPARVKREAIIRLRKEGKYAKRLYLWMFVLALYHLLKEHFEKIDVVVIDEEYVGKEADIKGLVTMLFRRKSVKMPQIVFRQITRRSPAHKVAIAVIRGKTKANKVLTTDELLKPTKARK